MRASRWWLPLAFSLVTLPTFARPLPGPSLRVIRRVVDLDRPTGAAWDPSQGGFLVCEARGTRVHAGPPGALRVVTPLDRGLAPLWQPSGAEELRAPWDVAVHAGRAWVADGAQLIGLATRPSTAPRVVADLSPLGAEKLVAVEVLPGGEALVTADGPSGQLLLYDLASGRSRLLTTAADEVVWDLAPSPEGVLLATTEAAARETRLRRWRRGHLELLARWRGLGDPGLARRGDATLFASSWDSAVLTLDDEGRPRGRLAGLVHGPARVATSPDGTWTLIVEHRGGSVYVLGPGDEPPPPPAEPAPPVEEDGFLVPPPLPPIPPPAP